MMVEGVRIPTTAHHAHQHIIPSLENRHAVVGLGWQPRCLAPGPQHGVRRSTTVDEPIHRTAAGHVHRDGLPGQHLLLHFDMDGFIHLRQEEQVLVSKRGVGVTVGAIGNFHPGHRGVDDDGPHQSHLDLQIRLSAAVELVGSRFTGGERIGDGRSTGHRLHGECSRRTAAGHTGLAIHPREQQRRRHRQFIGQGDGHLLPLNEQQGRPRVLRSPIPRGVPPEIDTVAIGRAH